MVEHHVANVVVVGSTPITRSTFPVIEITGSPRAGYSVVAGRECLVLRENATRENVLRDAKCTRSLEA